jgi:Protein of unknown function (DUF2442)
MEHAIYAVSECEVIAGSRLRLTFSDGLTRTIDLSGVLYGELYGPLRDPDFFAQVAVDPEVHTVTWPNGADFDPATLHDWPEHEAAWLERARRWRLAAV